MKNVIRPSDIDVARQQYESAASTSHERGDAGQRMAWQQPHEKIAIGSVATIQLGVIQAVLPHGRTYRVALQDNRILTCTFAADTSAHLIFGVDDCTTLLPGTMVWVVHEPGSTVGTILAVQPSTMDEYGSYVPLDTVCGSNVGLIDDAWQKNIRQAFTGRRTLPAWKGFRLDATPGEWGKCTRTGGMISLDPMLAVLQVNPFCGVSAHLPNLFLRLCGGSYALFTKYSEEIVINRLYAPQQPNEHPADVYWDFGAWGIPLTGDPTTKQRPGKFHWYDLSAAPWRPDSMWRWRGPMGDGFQWWTADAGYMAAAMCSLSRQGWAILRGAHGVMLSAGWLHPATRKYALDGQQGDHEKDAKRFLSLENIFVDYPPYQPTEIWDFHNKLHNWCIPAGQYAFPDKFNFSTTQVSSPRDGKICITPEKIFLDVAGQGITVDANGVRITGHAVTIDCGHTLQLIGKRIMLGALDMIQGRAGTKIHWLIERAVEGGGGGSSGEEPPDTRADLLLHFNDKKAVVYARPRFKAPKIEVQKLFLEECEGIAYVDETVPYPEPHIVFFPAWGFLMGPTQQRSSSWLAVVPIPSPMSIIPPGYDITPMQYFGLAGLRGLDHSVIQEFYNLEAEWYIEQSQYPFW